MESDDKRFTCAVLFLVYYVETLQDSGYPTHHFLVNTRLQPQVGQVIVRLACLGKAALEALLHNVCIPLPEPGLLPGKLVDARQVVLVDGLPPVNLQQHHAEVVEREVVDSVQLHAAPDSPGVQELRAVLSRCILGPPGKQSLPAERGGRRFPRG